MILSLIATLSFLTTPCNLLEDNLVNEIVRIRTALESRPSVSETADLLSEFKKNFWTISVPTAVKNIPGEPRDWIPGLLVDLASSRLELHRLIEFYRGNGLVLSTDQINLFRTANRNLRSIGEEAMAMIPREVRVTMPLKISDQPVKAFVTGLSMNTFFAESFRGEETSGEFEADYDLMRGLRSGDVFVVRGSSEISSLIARIPQGRDADGQASHLFVAYQDDDGKWWTLEALIEDGLKIRPFTFFSEPHARFTIYRMKDAEIAARGAKRLYETIRRMNKAGRQVRYNFSMRPFDFARLLDGDDIFEAYCAQSHQLQALYGSNGEIIPPVFPSLIQMNHPWLLDKLKIENGSRVFAPSDSDLDPHFDFVLEKSNPEMAHQAHIADAIITVLLAKMDKGNTIRPGVKSFIAKDIVLPVRRTIEPLPDWLPLIGALKRKFPWYIEADQLEFMVLLNDLFVRIKKEYLKHEAKYLAEFGTPMSWKEMLNEVYIIIRNHEKIRSRFPGSTTSGPELEPDLTRRRVN